MLIEEIRGLIRKDTRLQILLFVALIVQVIICTTAVGLFHPDQYFQIIEFSTYQLNRPSAATTVWEFAAHIRPTLQVYLFSAWYKGCMFLSIRDPYLQLTILRVLFGLTLFVFFNALTFYYLRAESRKVLFYSLLILNFSWALPYMRTLYSSEMLSSLLLFWAIFLSRPLEAELSPTGAELPSAGAEANSSEKNRDRRRWWIPLLAGLLLGFAFYARFQTAFAIAGFGCWMLFFEKKYWKLLPMAAGFIVSLLINIGLDHNFYHALVFTPVDYFRVNIFEGKASSMGTSSFLSYIGVLLAVALAPPFSLFLLYSGFRTAILKKYAHPVFLAIVFFIIGHCLVAHKEDRFLFPIVNMLPIIIGWGLPALGEWYNTRKKGMQRFVRGIAIFTITINTIALAFSLFVPYCQPIYFTWKLKETFKDQPVTIYAVSRTPFETDARLPFVFYKSGVPNMTFHTISVYDSIRYISDRAGYITMTYDRLNKNKQLLDSLGYEKCFASSGILWGLEELLHANHLDPVNDVWVLYKKKQ